MHTKTVLLGFQLYISFILFICRLRGSRDINRLSDKILLYIFSLLMPKDVYISAQVPN